MVYRRQEPVTWDNTKFTQIPNHVARCLALGMINANAFSVYNELVDHLNVRKNGNVVWPPNHKIGKRIGKSSRTVSAAITQLVEAGIVSHGGHPNRDKRKLHLLVYVDKTNRRVVGKPTYKLGDETKTF